MVDLSAVVSLEDAPDDFKIHLLTELGLGSDGEHVLDVSGEIVHDRYTGRKVTLKRMLILPGSTVVIDNSPISIASYLEEFGDPF